MTNIRIEPAGIAPPAANYVHGVKSVASEVMVHTSGVVPVAPDGSVPSDLAAQARIVWANISVILADAGLRLADIVSVVTYVVSGHGVAEVMAERDRALDGHLAASTLVMVPELAQPGWKMEISVVAAR